MKDNHYPKLAVMSALSFIAMYVLMYAMVDSFGNVFNNLNQAFMAGLMASPMVLIELWLMRGMYHNTRANAAIAIAALAVGLLCFAAIRRQTAISDRQFLRSMIPHHGAAILMCEEAPVQDARVRALCGQIISSQQAEIATMKALLEE